MYDSPEITRRIAEWYRTGRVSPFMLELRPTNLCNLKCPSCLARGYPKYTPGEELSEEDYERIIDEAAELGVKYVQISGGGEPFVRREKVLAIMRRIKRRGMAGWVISNGTRFDEEAIEEIVSMKWDTLFLSLDAPDPVVNDYLRSSGGSFDKLVSAIQLFNSKKEKYGCDVPQVHIGSVLSHYTCRLVGEMIALCAKLAVGMVTFQPVHTRGDGEGEHLLLTEDDLAALAAQIPHARGLASEHGIQHNLDSLDRGLLKNSNNPQSVIIADASRFQHHPLLSIPCYFPWFYIGITASGAVGTCSILDEHTYRGNIRSMSLKEFWTRSHFEEMRSRLQSRQLLPPCQRCVGTHMIEMRQMREQLNNIVS